MLASAWDIPEEERLTMCPATLQRVIDHKEERWLRSHKYQAAWHLFVSQHLGDNKLRPEDLFPPGAGVPW